METPLTKIPRPAPPFPHRLKKKVDEGKFSKIMAILKQLSVNVPLVEDLEKILGYAKFKKDLVTKKRIFSYVPMDNLHYCSAIVTISLVQKKSNPREFTKIFTIGAFSIAKALCYLGESFNLMPLENYQHLGL